MIKFLRYIIYRIFILAFVLYYQPCSIADTIFIQDRPKEDSSKILEKGSKLWHEHLIVPEDVPRIAIYDEYQQPVMFRDFKGNVIVVVFWASWCLECVEELASLNQLAEDLVYHEIENVHLVPLSIDFKDEKFQKDLLQSNKIKNLKFYSDKNKELMSYLGVNSLPTSFIIDPEGKIILRTNKHFTWSDPGIVDEINKMSKKITKK